MSSPKKKSQARSRAPKAPSLVYTVKDIRRLLRVGRAAAYALARKLGTRIGQGGRGRLFVSRRAFEAWLEAGEQ